MYQWKMDRASDLTDGNVRVNSLVSWHHVLRSNCKHKRFSVIVVNTVTSFFAQNKSKTDIKTRHINSVFKL